MHLKELKIQACYQTAPVNTENRSLIRYWAKFNHILWPKRSIQAINENSYLYFFSVNQVRSMFRSCIIKCALSNWMWLHIKTHHHLKTVVTQLDSKTTTSTALSNRNNNTNTYFSNPYTQELRCSPEHMFI